MNKNFGSSLWKDIFRTIKSSLGRFLAIVAMTGLSTMVFIGLSSGVPNMRSMIIDRVQDHKLHDVRISSYTGIRDGDVDIINSLEDLDHVEYVSDAAYNLQDYDYSISLMTLPESLDTPILREGRLPENNKEIALDLAHKKDHGDMTGQVLKFITDEDDDLKEDELKVVGYVDSVDYIMNDRSRSSQHGNYFAYVTKDTLVKEFPDSALLKFSANDMDVSSQEYKDLETKRLDQITDLFAERPKTVEGIIKEEANSEIADAREEIAQGRQDLEDARNDLDQAKDDLDQALIDLEDGQTEIDDGQAEIDDGWADLNQAQEDLDREIASARADLEDAQAQVDSSQADLDQTKDEYNQGRAQYESETNAAYQTLLESEAQLSESKQMLEGLKMQIDQGIIPYDIGMAQYTQALDQYNQGLAQYNQGLAQYESEKNAGLEELNQAARQIDQGQEELNAAQEEINQGYADLEANRLEAQEEIDQARRDLQDAETELADARDDLNQGQIDYEEGLQEYQDGLQEYQDEEPQALEDIADGEKEIADIEKELESLRVPLYNIEGKYDNSAFFTYLSQADSLNNLSIIFTAMFYMVAILVTLTTVLRMVETERTQIGTMKALGYGRKTILLKYMVYGLSATLIGSLFGIVIGFFVLMPPVISAYVSATNLTDNPMIFKPSKAVLIVLISIVLISSTIYLSVGKSLRENAASLMRPKPPKKASRILLERVPFIWERLSFLNKVSIRNVMRHKIRMIMTILGVSGSFGLIAMAFGLQTSINNVASRQFDGVYHYQAQLIYDDSKSDFEPMMDFVEVTTSDYLDTIYTQASVRMDSGMQEDLTLIAVDDIDKIDDFIKLRVRGSDQRLKLEDDKIIISEKLSTSLGLSIGDELIFRDPNGIERAMEISGITEQYFGHQAYLTKDTYIDQVDDLQKNNNLLLKFDGLDDDQIAGLDKDFSEFDAKQGYVPMVDLEDTLNTLSDSLRIVIVLVVALSAMLTFVVLYNLTNINISERIREISTIKVLGFSPKEVVSYIFKENFILTFVGMLVGIGFAKFMHVIIVYALSPAGFLFDPYLNPLSYLWAGLIVLVFTILVMLFAKRSMDRINMVEALKAVD